MRTIVACMVVGLGAGWAARVAAAQIDPPAEDAPEARHARPRLIADRFALVPGEPAWLGVTFEIDPGWHLYWDGRNDTGMPPIIRWRLPQGVKAGETRWPAPVRHVWPGDLLDHVYERRVTILLPVEVDPGVEPGQRLTFEADLEWLVCDDVCLADQGRVSLTLPVAAPGSSPGGGRDAALIREARERLPRPAEEAGPGLAISWEDDAAVIEFAGAESLAFYPANESVRLVNPIRDAAAEGARLEMEYEFPEQPPARLVGVLEVRQAGRTRSYQVDAEGPVPFDAGRGRSEPDNR